MQGIYEFRGRKILFAIVMGTYMLPAAATYIPSYIILAKTGTFKQLHGSDNLRHDKYIWNIFVKTGFMQVPTPLIDAGKDGWCRGYEGFVESRNAHD